MNRRGNHTAKARTWSSENFRKALALDEITRGPLAHTCVIPLLDFIDRADVYLTDFVMRKENVILTIDRRTPALLSSTERSAIMGGTINHASLFPRSQAPCMAPLAVRPPGLRLPF
jgi:hypothetical protein